MRKTPLRDLIIVLPGIMGSVLQRNGAEVWGLSVPGAWNYVSSGGASLDHLRLTGEDPIDVDDIGDGVRATALIPGVTFVPGLIKIDGYSRLLNTITRHFDVKPGAIGTADEQANFFTFAYDWRRDNRVAARQLESFIKLQLYAWRRSSFNQQARVILIAHSMGGYVARHYLEVLGGWRDCRALITFGTPYRGSLKALGFLANGYKKLWHNMTEAVRSFTSVYQLLPIYQAVQREGSFWRVAELEGIPNVEHTRAKDALAFHRTIEAAVTVHRSDPEYLDHGYRIFPIVGTRQPTMQSAVQGVGQLSLSYELPAVVDPLLGDGDGTVPRISAIPIELSERYYNTFVPERHSSLQAHGKVLEQICEWIKEMQARGQQNVRGPEPQASDVGWPAISLDVEDTYAPGEEVKIHARVVNVPPQVELGLEAEISSLDREDVPTSNRKLEHVGDNWVIRDDNISSGVYRITVRATRQGPWLPAPVHDIFGVLR